jgi:glycosyltransferase involved in cell wall biosynthesis
MTRKKNKLLGQARSLLMPILWEEPFGAMACGTPVLGFARGPAPEVIDRGVTAFVAKDVDGLVSATGRIGNIGTAACRTRVERLFSDRAVVERNVAIYAEMIAQKMRKTA